MTHSNAVQKRPKTKHKLLQNQKGVSTVEYIIVLVLIAVACIAMWSKFGKTVHEKIKASEDGVSGLVEDHGE
jgi:Flp pilus assembly pilin Flp